MKARSVDHAVSLVGMTQCGTLMIGIVARQAIAVEGVDLTKFWDFSTKRAQAMSYLVKHIRVCSNDAAHTFGLFCDIGIPLLTERFPDYPETIARANSCTEGKFTDVEDQAHSTNHTAIGALMARTWGLQDEITTAILLHHDYKTLDDPSTDDSIRGLIALALLAEFAIQKYHGLDLSVEWEKGGKAACHFLGISEHDASDRFEELYELFNQAQ